MYNYLNSFHACLNFLSQIFFIKIIKFFRKFRIINTFLCSEIEMLEVLFFQDFQLGNVPNLKMKILLL